MNYMIAAARRILAASSDAARANVFGAVGELDHAVAMEEKWNNEDTLRQLAQALVRVANQRQPGLASAVFVWDAAELTHHFDKEEMKKVCAQL